ncbi:MAG: hypothetical protein PSV46_22710 [Reyranella sp.]|nr:hypothetical protein [Reyranella sp.]
MKVPALRWQLALAFTVSLAVLAGQIVWLENVHVLTTNGMYKSLQGEPWIADPAHATLDASNYLFFPLYGALCRLLDAVGFLRGAAWQQFAYLNAFWASLCVTFVYAFIHRVTARAAAAALAACFHLGSGYFLLLATINEDIMPGYTIVFAAMALAGLWFDRPTYRRVVLVGVVFSLGWLIEWRLIFPTLPALVLALALSKESMRRRLALIGALIASIVAVAGLAALVTIGHSGSVGPEGLLWTGKGVETGWAGLNWDKAWMLLAGIGSYFLIFGALIDLPAIRLSAIALSVSVLIQAALLVATLVALWPRRGDRRLRAIALVFLGTFGAGEVFNFYSQPQDPQMQINVMPWLTVAWGLLAAHLLAAGGTVRARGVTLAVLGVVALAPLAWNLAQLARWRGADTVMVKGLAALERRFPTDQTVFLYWGFESVTTWQFALWSHTWDSDLWNSAQTPALSPAPKADPKFKWIALTAGGIRHPGWTPEEHAAALKRDIDRALDLGYQVVASDFWDWDAAELASQLSGLSAANRAQAIYKMLHDNYVASPVFYVRRIGVFHELQRR